MKNAGDKTSAIGELIFQSKTHEIDIQTLQITLSIQPNNQNNQSTNRNKNSNPMNKKNRNKSKKFD